MIPIFSAEEVRSADKFAIEKLNYPSIVLMENAAISIFNAIRENYPYLDKSYEFGIICGKGNNGGDGFALARHLLLNGFDVKVISLADEKTLKGDALTNFKLLKNFIKDYPGSSLTKFNSISSLKTFLNCQIIVDALLGTGFTGKLKPPYDKIVQKLNSLETIKIAIDSPTGLDLNNSSGDIIFNSHLTVTLAALKTGLFYEKGKIFSGKVLKGSIGLGEKYFDNIGTDNFLVEPEDVINYLPKRTIDSNKYSVGSVLVIAGSVNMPGAALFAMNAAMNSGAGSGYLAIPKNLRFLAQSKMNSAITIGLVGEDYIHKRDLPIILQKLSSVDTVALGPGLGRNEETIEAVIEILNNCNTQKSIIDADAIFALGQFGYKKVNLRNKILTPHHGEFATLMNISVTELKADLLNIGKEFSMSTGAFLVLKGAPTIIFNPDGESFINTSGNAGLAKFGSGDVLTGVIAAFVSQQESIENSLIASVYLHGLAADLIMKQESEYGIVPNKLIEFIPKSIKFIRKSIV